MEYISVQQAQNEKKNMLLQQKAFEILANCPKRPLIALDLDYTVRTVIFFLVPFLIVVSY
jgi:hypothetical protein